MTRKPHFFTGALIAALGLLTTLGWTVTEAVTANRHFEGQISILIGAKQADGAWKLIDEATARVRLDASVLELASGGKEVTSGYVWNGRTKNDQSFSIRLAHTGGANANVNLQQGILQLVNLPFEVRLNGKRFEQPLTLSTEQTVSGPRGLLRGRRFTINNGQAPILLVGTTRYVEQDNVRKAVDSGSDQALRVKPPVAGTAFDVLVAVEGVVSSR